MSETVLIIGATGNIGVAAAHGALKSGRKVLAIVRNDDSAQKLFDALNTKEGITTVQADVGSESGVQSVVEQVEAGKLPAFQHVYSTVGGLYELDKLKDITPKKLQAAFERNFWPNFYAYHATIGYLLKQNNPNSTWTLCTGGEGDRGQVAGPAITQGPLYSFAAAAAHENADTNVRFNEVYLMMWVNRDNSLQEGAMKSTVFADNYATILARPDVRSQRIFVSKESELTDLHFEKKGITGPRTGSA